MQHPKHPQEPQDIESIELQEFGEIDPSTPVCRHLRTKMYYVGGQFSAEMGNSSDASHYWCLHSMEPFGPDGHFVCPEDCSSSRRCFEER